MRRDRAPNEPKSTRCAIYTRKSTEEGLEQEFNSLDAQREACAAYILSQKHEGWTTLPERYDDGGYSGGTLERPALYRLLADVEAGKVDAVVVYKVDRLTRSLADFARIVGDLRCRRGLLRLVTQAFNTTTSMGRLTLNVLLSFAQFEREVTAERIRDKIAASKAKGMWMGGIVPIGYRAEGRSLVPVPGRSGAGAADLRALPRARLGECGPRRPERQRHPDAERRHRSGRGVVELVSRAASSTRCSAIRCSSGASGTETGCIPGCTLRSSRRTSGTRFSSASQPTVAGGRPTACPGGQVRSLGEYPIRRGERCGRATPIRRAGATATMSARPSLTTASPMGRAAGASRRRNLKRRLHAPSPQSCATRSSRRSFWALAKPERTPQPRSSQAR